MYCYSHEKPKLFTEENQVLFLKIRDKCHKLLDEAGAFTMEKAIKGCGGDVWTLMACVDRLVELDDLQELTGAHVPGQYRTFIRRY
jgi:hypothetical protein